MVYFLLYQNTVHNLEVLDKTITNIKTDINKSLTFSDTNIINERLQDIHNIQSLKLREKQRKKFFRDGINPNKNIPSELSVTSGETTRRKRRFSRHKEINRDQNDTVVNLSSKDLKQDNSVGIFLFGLIPSLKNFLRCFSRSFRL
jgi:hypothetical protein